jgi:hypothetical protein
MEHLISPEDPMGLFELKEELAEGSFGVVYKGKSIRNVALRGDSISISRNRKR